MDKLAIVILALAMWSPTPAATIAIGPNGCSLADAIRSANTNNSVGNCAAGSGSGDDTIVAPDGWVIPIANTLPTITSDMTIRPQTDSGVLTVSGDFDHKIMRVNGSDTNLVLRGVKLINGRVGSALETGGAALDINQATVVLVDSEVSGNSVTDNTGSAIHVVQGTLIIDSSLIRSNSMRITGNFSPIRTAVYASDSMVEVIDSTFTDNIGVEPDLISASIFMDGGELLFENSLVDEFRYGLRGEQAIVTIINSTFVTSFDPGFEDDLVFFSDNSFVELRHVTLDKRIVLRDSILSSVNTIFSGCDFDNVSMILDQGNFNRFGNCRGGSDGAAELRPIADNGGTTRTKAIGFPSDLIDSADQAFCEATDQRGMAREFLCDIGAYEQTGTADVSVHIEVFPGGPFAGDQTVTATLEVINSGPALATFLEIDVALLQADLSAINSSVCAAFPCTIESLAPGQILRIPFELTTRDVVSASLVVDASAVSTTQSTHQDPNESNLEGNNFDSFIAPILEAADLSIELELLTPGPYFVGQPVKHEAVIRNAGPRKANGVTMDFEPDGMSFLDFDDCPDTSGTTCMPGDLPSGGQVSVTMNSEITASLFDAGAETMADELDINLGNNEDRLDNGGGVRDGNLGVDMLLLTSPPYYGGQFLEFEIKLSAIQGDLSNIVITSDLPGGQFIGVDGCSTGFPCTLPFTIAAGTSQTVGANWFAPTRDPSGAEDWTHTVVAYPGETEIDESDNTVDISRPLAFASDIASQMQLVSAAPYYAGQEIEYALRVVNGGLSDATSVSIELAPENIELVFATGQQCATVDCLIPELDRFNDEVLTLVYRILEPGEFDLVASAAGPELDPVPLNNIDDAGNGGDALAVPDLDLIFYGPFEPDPP